MAGTFYFGEVVGNELHGNQDAADELGEGEDEIRRNTALYDAVNAQRDDTHKGDRRNAAGQPGYLVRQKFPVEVGLGQALADPMILLAETPLYTVIADDPIATKDVMNEAEVALGPVHLNALGLVQLFGKQSGQPQGKKTDDQEEQTDPGIEEKQGDHGKHEAPTIFIDAAKAFEIGLL